MKTKPKAIPPDLSVDGVDGWHNWNFNGVENWEIAACCRWEYARESEAIRRRVLIPEEERDYLREHEEDFDLFLDSSSFPAPWLSLPTSERECRTELLTLGPDMRKEPPVAPGHWGIVKHCFDLARKSASAQANLPAKYTPDIFKNEINPVAPPPPNLPETEVLLSINWYAYSHDEIITEFRKWLKNKRPSLRKRTGRPRGFDPFAALDGLAIMRLLSLYTPTQAKVIAPDLFKRHQGKQVFRTRKTALRNFRQLFPGLPAHERPLTWKTKAGRTK